VSGAPIVGVLLAAGSALRFGSDKLAAKLPGGEDSIGVAALKNLAAAVDQVVVVVRPGEATLAGTVAQLAQARLTVCPDAAEGMGASLAWGVRAAPAAGGWIIALADMPWLQPQTIVAIRKALESGATIAAPVHEGKRGHPVGFSRALYPRLAALSGDEGAKLLLEQQPVSLLASDDRGVLRDVDTPADLER
jgi:molybdenum cofactor cytidylyltransferase